MKRINSNPYKPSDPNKNFDEQSIFISGNLLPEIKPVYDLDSDDDDDEAEEYDREYSHNTDIDNPEEEPGAEEKMKKADDILQRSFGVRVLELVAGYIIDGQLSSMEIIIQALAYRCQKLKRGKSGIRYKDSWGIFWCGVRTIIRGRGIVPFLDHFDVPSKLSKFKPKMLECCGLDSDSLGKAGLQVRNVGLWLSERKKEIGDKTVCLSLSFDGKKIAMSSDGQEDMGGVGGAEMKSKIDLIHEEEKKRLLDLLKKDDRQSLYLVYDALSSSGKSVIDKIGSNFPLSPKSFSKEQLH